MKKIFIIAPHFPPSALPPSQRVRLMVKHLHKLSYYPHVFTTEPKYREEKKDAWMTELAGNDFDLTVVKALSQKKTRRFRIGDLGLRMLPFLYPKLKKNIKTHKPDFILYPVPPWYILLIAPRLKKKFKIPYGIDFIDPWVVPEAPNDNFKKKISQKIARKFEKRAVENADIIYSVSEGINKNLSKQYNIPKKTVLHAIPYGVEPSDFKLNYNKQTSEKVLFRYIGGVWPDAYPVLETLLSVLSDIEKDYPLSIEFIGTSYAGESIAKKQTGAWINDFNMESYMTEDALRIPYKKAVELTLSADIMLLFGGMQTYYAASKLMGMIASGKPFIAFLHKESFPAIFLHKLNYPYIVTYSDIELPGTKKEHLKSIIIDIINKKDKFVKFDLNHPLIKENTAFGMTEKFVKPINELLNTEND